MLVAQIHLMMIANSCGSGTLAGSPGGGEKPSELDAGVNLLSEYDFHNDPRDQSVGRLVTGGSRYWRGV